MFCMEERTAQGGAPGSKSGSSSRICSLTLDWTDSLARSVEESQLMSKMVPDTRVPFSAKKFSGLNSSQKSTD